MYYDVTLNMSSNSCPSTCQLNGFWAKSLTVWSSGSSYVKWKNKHLCHRTALKIKKIKYVSQMLITLANNSYFW